MAALHGLILFRPQKGERDTVYVQKEVKNAQTIAEHCRQINW